MKLAYDDEAIEEAMASAEWYETRQEGLAKPFLTEWKKAENRMVADPEINRSFDGDLRKCRFEVFPYSLIYRIIAADELQVVAVMHQSRKPGYWRGRLKD